MDDEEARTIGRRLREIREARGKTLEVIAGLAGITESYLSLLENGKRALNRRSRIVALANALEVSPGELFDLGASPLPADPATESAVAAVRDAMQAVMMGLPGGQVQPVEQLRVRADTALAAKQACREAEVGAMLPALIRDLHTSIEAGRDDAELLRIATLLYSQAVEGWLFTVHESGDLAWQAACLSREAAQRLDEPVALGVATFGLANGLLATGGFELAGLLLADTPETGDHQLDGMLSLTRCLLAASDSRPADVEAPLAVAAELAERTGDGNAHYMSFGPSNVGLWRMSVALEAGEEERAAELSDAVDLSALPPKRRANYYVNRARALSQVRRREEAVTALRAAERISPDSVCRSPGTRRVLSELVARTRDEALGRELRGMAYRAGLPF
ncbi:MAG: helix-turn-helix domain-containing protein [Pseudonocardiaceae bacterium]